MCRRLKRIATGPAVKRSNSIAVASATSTCIRGILATLQKREGAEVEQMACTAVGGGWAVAVKSFINGVGEGGGVMKCNRDTTDGARFSESLSSESDNGERVCGVEGNGRGVVFDGIVCF